MTQQDFDLIVKILKNGAPAIADELVNSIVNLLNENTRLAKKLELIEGG